MKTFTARYSAKVAATYALVASSYIVCSDLLVKRLSDSVQQIGHLQTLKGWGFVLVTSFSLFVVLRQKWKLSQAEISSRQKVERELRQEKAFYRDLVDTQPGGIYRLRVRPPAKARPATAAISAPRTSPLPNAGSCAA